MMRRTAIISLGMLLMCCVPLSAQDQIQTRDWSAVKAKSNDFGLSLNLGLEKKLAYRLSLNLEGELRTQDNSGMIERLMAGGSLQYKIYQTYNKKFVLKSSLGFEYIWKQNMRETSDFSKLAEHYNDEGVFNGYNERIGYKDTDSYWRNRWRTSLAVSATYSPSKRWSFTLKETLQYNRYCSTDSIYRTRTSNEFYKWREFGTDIGNLEDYGYRWAEVTDEDGQTYTTYYYDANKYEPNSRGNKIYEKETPDKTLPYTEDDLKSPRKAKDKWVLRSKLTIEYNVKGLPLNPYVSLDYGCGLNYSANKWKYSVGAEYKLTKKHKFDLFYRFSHDDDDDEPNGHLIGMGFKYSF